MAAAAAPGADAFDTYFRKADFDRDGRISGQEAVAFFQGSNLPKHVLAQIWMYADQNKIGYLGRVEFYNALRLVTVAQSGRELTQDIVKAALYGPAAAKIPAPKITYVTAPGSQVNSVVPPLQTSSILRPSTEIGPVGVLSSTTPQNLGFTGPSPTPNMGMNQQVFSSGSLYTGTMQARPPAAPLPIHEVGQGHFSKVNNAYSQPPKSASLSTDWLGGMASGTSIGGPSQMLTSAIVPTVSQNALSSARPVATSGLNPLQMQSAIETSTARLQDTVASSFQTVSKDLKALSATDNGFSSESLFGSDIFSARSQENLSAYTSAFSSGILTSISTSNAPNTSSTIGSVTSGPQAPNQFGLNSVQSALSASSVSDQLTQSLAKENHPAQNTSGLSVSNSYAKNTSSVSSESEVPWPRITQADIQKYNKVFLEVDKDRDGRITGEQARNLFLSWKLPRDVLRQVWDLSDQDNDSMLSLREFCFALYLMERYREGCALPAVLPDSLKFDETLLRATGQPSSSFGVPAWQATPGIAPQLRPGIHLAVPIAGMRPPLPPGSGTYQTDGTRQQAQPLPLTNVANERNRDTGGTDPKIQEAQVPEKEILDSRDKIEFYRTKMQELVFYKSRCDNRLNEITERASADKREVETLGKKYEEKYKQVGDVASKLVVEEARFRDIQERKSELQKAIVNVEQGKSADGLLQVRADRIQSDLEELEKALNQRCKQHAVDVKPTTTIKLPFGWQPNVQEGAADWDEDWDKFEDEGFTIANDLMGDEGNLADTTKQKSPLYQNDSSELSPVVSSSKLNGSMDKVYIGGDQFVESESNYAHSDEGSARSPRGSPERSVFASPSEEDIYSSQFDDVSPHSKENHGDHLSAAQNMHGEKYADGHSWGAAFDSNDESDSVWGFSTLQESHHEKSEQSSFFDSTDFGLNPIKVDSPSASGVAAKGKSTFFADSVPSSPFFSSSPPQEYGDGHEERRFGRFDSFGTNDSGLFSQPRNLARFDSISSSIGGDSGHNHGGGAFQSFDDADPFGTGPFKPIESPSPSRAPDHWNVYQHE